MTYHFYGASGRQSSSPRAAILAPLALASLVLAAPPSLAAPITTPTSLPPGAHYRLAFVTAGVHDALSSNIADYDAFVMAEARTEAALGSFSWRAIASTATVSARDHTGTGPADFPGIPIFLLNGTKLVDDYADLWDGGVDAPLAIDQHGFPVNVEVWSGTYASGLSGRFLGTYQPGTGSSASTADTWIGLYGGRYTAHFPLPFYAMSEVLSIPVSEPESLPLLAVMLTACLVVRRRAIGKVATVRGLREETG
jgi:hypothetical protein